MSLGLAAAEPRLRPVATTAQPGPVGYRDALGVVSPDGAWLAFTSGTHLRLRRLEGGPVAELGPADRNLTHLAWLPDGRHLASSGRNPDSGEAGWILHDIGAGTRAPLWPDQPRIARLRQLAWWPDGSGAVAVEASDSGSELVRLDARGAVIGTTRSAAPLSQPVPSPDGQTLACLALVGDRPRLSLPCGQVDAAAPEAYGPLAFSPDGAALYFARPNDHGTLDLWARHLADRRDTQLTHFARDSYAPSVMRDGRVLFKLQDYGTWVASLPASGGVATPLTTFQSETPTWDPTGRQLGVTYGHWRRVADDFHYPDIAQDLGLVSLDGPLPANSPTRIVRATASEDQALCWSPNGRWIALHSHLGADDIFLMPADLSRPARQISTGGSETGWPRWSPDGRFVAYTTDVAGHGPRRVSSWERPREQNAIVLIGVDQQTGEITQPQQPVRLDGFAGQPLHAEWAPDAERLFFDSNDGGARRSLNVVARTGGRPVRIHAFESEQGFSGFGASPDGRFLAFVAPAPDGYFQIFRVPVAGGTPEQLSFDPTHKTQPSYSPDGRTLALTVWRYEIQLWLLEPGGPQ